MMYKIIATTKQGGQLLNHADNVDTIRINKEKAVKEDADKEWRKERQLCQEVNKLDHEPLREQPVKNLEDVLKLGDDFYPGILLSGILRKCGYEEEAILLNQRQTELWYGSESDEESAVGAW